MNTVNRSAVIVLPGKPFIKWARSVDDEAAKFTAADLRREATVYLIPEVDDADHAEELLSYFSARSGNFCTNDRHPRQGPGQGRCQTISSVAVRRRPANSQRNLVIAVRVLDTYGDTHALDTQTGRA